ncbi:unnamed protein product [Pedinophyceae sp. YPF-701]|nr:unnamed protein product [Pedinophyceae sp. YPF-701]
MEGGKRTIETETRALRAAVRALLDAGAAGDAAAIAAATQQGLNATMRLKAAHRATVRLTNEQQRRTEEARAVAQRAGHALRNVQYEERHFQSEIRQCKDFAPAHADAEIGLVDAEEFFATAPEALTQGLDPGDAHAVMLRRLDHELAQRQALQKELAGLKRRRDEAGDALEARKRVVDVVHHVEKVEGALEGVEAQLGTSFARRVRASRLAELLPAPLYVAYAALVACRDAHRDAVSVAIAGPLAAAQQWMAAHGAARRPPEGELSATHPLSLAFTVLPEGSTTVGTAPTTPATMEVALRYLPSVHLVTAVVEKLNGEACSAAASDALLTELFPGDAGAALPAHAATCDLAALNASCDEAGLGRPYLWALRLAGIDVLPVMPFLPARADPTAPSALEGAVRDYRFGGHALRCLGLLRARVRVADLVDAQVRALGELAKKAGGLAKAGLLTDAGVPRAVALAALVAAPFKVGEEGGEAEATEVAFESLREVEGAAVEQEGDARAEGGSDGEEDAEGGEQAGKRARAEAGRRSWGDAMARGGRVFEASLTLKGRVAGTVAVHIGFPRRFPLGSDALPALRLARRPAGMSEDAALQVVAASGAILKRAEGVLGGGGDGEKSDVALPESAEALEPDAVDLVDRQPHMGPEPNWTFAGCALRVAAACVVAGVRQATAKQ